MHGGNPNTYEFEDGMTWKEWVESKYNTDGFEVRGEYVYSSAGAFNISISPNDVIGEITYYFNEIS